MKQLLRRAITNSPVRVRVAKISKFFGFILISVILCIYAFLTIGSGRYFHSYTMHSKGKDKHSPRSDVTAYSTDELEIIRRDIVIEKLAIKKLCVVILTHFVCIFIFVIDTFRSR